MVNKETNINMLFNLDKICFGDKAYSLEHYNQMILNKSYQFFTIINDDNVKIGFIVILDNLDNNFELIKIGIAPNYQGKGYGYNALKELLEKIDYNTIVLEVSEFNINAINLYKKLGFELSYIRKKYYKDNSNALIMSKKQDNIL